MAGIKSIGATGHALVDDLLGARGWGERQVSFGFSVARTDYAASYGENEPGNGFAALSPLQQAAARKAMDAWDELIAIDLVETAGRTADIRIAASEAPTTAWAYTPGTAPESGDVWFGRARDYYSDPKPGDYASHTMIHEIGHALGLIHPHEAPFNAANDGGFVADDGGVSSLCPCCAGLVHGGAGSVASPASRAVADTASAAQDAGTFYGASVASAAVDAMPFSVMSYSSYAGDGRGGYTNEAHGFTQSPMLRDIAAIQHIYGADYSTRAGDTVYGWSAQTGEKFINGVGQGRPGDNRVLETIWDGGGRDTIDLAAHHGDLTIDLSPGGWTDFGNDQIAHLGNGHYAPGNVALAWLSRGDPRALIENAVGGAGDDDISGNTGDNVLVGGPGDDELSAGAGNNILVGDGLGNELTLVDLDRSDWISATFLPASAAGNDVLTGGAGSDIFVPGGGANIVTGGGGLDTIVIDLVFAAIKIAAKGLDLFFTYDGGTAEAYDIDYLAARDGIYAVTGNGPGTDNGSTVARDPGGGADTGSIPVADGPADEIALLYTAGLGRQIEPAGFTFWAATLASGFTLSDMAANMIDSTEFAARFGEPDRMEDDAFLSVIYENVLDRPAEAEGAVYWTEALENGLTRPDLLLNFAVSPENRAKTEAAGGFDTAQAGAQGDAGGVHLVAVGAAQWTEFWG